MAAMIYSLCALTCLACAILLFRSHGQTRARQKRPKISPTSSGAVAIPPRRSSFTLSPLPR